MTPSSETAKKYEIGVLLPESERLSEVVEFLRTHGGEDILSAEAKQISLSYAINKRVSAYFAPISFSGDPAIIPPMERDLRLRPELVLRFLIIANPPTQRPTQLGLQSVRPVATRSATAPLSAEQHGGEASNEELEQKLKEILSAGGEKK